MKRQLPVARAAAEAPRAAPRPAAASVQDERRIVATTLAWPTCGPQFVSDWLAREGVRVAPVTVWRVLLRHQLGTRRARLAVVEAHSDEMRGVTVYSSASPVRRLITGR